MHFLFPCHNKEIEVREKEKSKEFTEVTVEQVAEQEMKPTLQSVPLETATEPSRLFGIHHLPLIRKKLDQQQLALHLRASIITSQH